MVLFEELLIDPVLNVGAVVILFALFATSAFEKLKDVETFKNVLDGYKLVPPVVLTPLSLVIPVLELTSALSLVMEATRSFGLVLAGGLLLIYSFVIGVSVLRGFQGIDCGCGTDHVPISWALLMRNIFVFTLPVIAFLPIADRQYGWLDIGLTAFLVIFWIAAYSLVNVLIRNDSLFQQLDS